MRYKYLPSEEEKREIKSEVVSRVMRDIFWRIMDGGTTLGKELNEVVSAEIERWKGDKTKYGKEMRVFFNKIRKRILKLSPTDRKYTIRRILELYLDEIQGHFSPLIYFLATRIVPEGLNILFNSFSLSSLMSYLTSFRLPRFDNVLHIEGDIRKIHKLCDRGIMVFLPTHQSHMDSLIIGYTIYKIGLPPCLYGAGLNLFESSVLGFFMSNLGAYKVDRKRKHRLYLDTLKEYVSFTMEKGYNHIFFPGGTRSRSGEVEQRLKMGLMGCGLKAYINNLTKGKETKIFFVPVTITYHIILEAESLIEEFLSLNEDFYYDEPEGIKTILGFIKRVLETQHKVFVKFSEVFDPFGNVVDDDGNSLNNGRIVDIRRYVLSGGEPKHDPERDAEYTKELAEKIAETYKKDNFVLSTNLASKAIFNIAKRNIEEEDDLKTLPLIYGQRISISSVVEEIERMKNYFLELEKNGKISVWESVKRKEGRGILDTSLKVFLSHYGKKSPFIIKGNDVVIQNPKLLFFYSNRLSGYES